MRMNLVFSGDGRLHLTPALAPLVHSQRVRAASTEPEKQIGQKLQDCQPPYCVGMLLLELVFTSACVARTHVGEEYSAPVSRDCANTRSSDMGAFFSSEHVEEYDAEEAARQQAALRQRLATLRLTPAGALAAVTRECCALRQQLAEWTHGRQTPPEPIIHIPQSHTNETGDIIRGREVTLVHGEGCKPLPPWPTLSSNAAGDDSKRAPWISERVTQLLVYLDNVDVKQEQTHMRQHRRSLVRQLQNLASQAQHRLAPSQLQVPAAPASGAAAVL